MTWYRGLDGHEEEMEWRLEVIYDVCLPAEDRWWLALIKVALKGNIQKCCRVRGPE